MKEKQQRTVVNSRRRNWIFISPILRTTSISNPVQKKLFFSTRSASHLLISFSTTPHRVHSLVHCPLAGAFKWMPWKFGDRNRAQAPRDERHGSLLQDQVLSAQEWHNRGQRRWWQCTRALGRTLGGCPQTHSVPYVEPKVGIEY